eukprot:scaffold17308_cov51-Attheya_sp.AAC.2
MMYWGTGPTGLALTHRPLLTFIKSMATIGRGAAQNMYNCTGGSAWVSHGNTDHTLDGSLHAESHWSSSFIRGRIEKCHWRILMEGERTTRCFGGAAR